MKIRLADANILTDSIVDGEGLRAVIWAQGCSHNCKGCHNPETHSFDKGVLLEVDELKQMIKDLTLQDGITLSGGDPFFQAEAMAEIAKYAKELGLNVWAYTGFLFEDLLKNEKTKNLLNYIDVLVDGKFVLENKILNIQVKKEESSISEKADLKTAMIIPLTDSQGVVGTLKIYYAKKYDMSHSKKSLAIGLSQIISTLMEISKIEKIENERKKSEIKALQRQINPHFLFNALNTITSFIRINPDKARKLIINLSTYMRYNLEVNDNLIDINKELEQVKAYVEIEKARFGDKLTVLYDIDENIEAKIPSLTIQPLVENAIIHGIRKNGGCGTVVIGVKKEDGYTRVWVENDGIAIDLDVIKKVYSGEMPDNKIGLHNLIGCLNL